MLAGAGDSLDNGAAQIPCASRYGNNTHLVQNTFSVGAKECKLTLVSKPDDFTQGDQWCFRPGSNNGWRL